MTDQYIQVGADSGGKKVDVSELTIGINTVERQRVVLADPDSANKLAGVDSLGNLHVVDNPIVNMLSAMLTELRAITFYLRTGLNVRDSVESVRKSVASDGE